MTNYESGKIAEFFARILLRLKGYKIIAKNFKAGKGLNIGEVDFIASRRKTLVFVEVKKRASLELAAYAVSQKQRRRIIRGAELFLKKNPKYAGFDVRFDVVLVAFPCHLEHIENAWNCESV